MKKLYLCLHSLPIIFLLVSLLNKKTHDIAGKEGFTGTYEAMLVEKTGEKVKIIKEDLMFAQAMFQFVKSGG